MLEIFRQRFASKTYCAALIGAILTIVEANYGVLAMLLPPRLMPYSPLIFPIVMIFCREITTSALSEK